MANTGIRQGAGSATLRTRAIRLASMVAAIVMLVTGSIVASNQPAFAEDYPSWDDVAAIRNDLSASRAEVARINGIIGELQRRVEETAAVAATAGDAWQIAENEYQAGYERTKALQLQADEANAKARQSSIQAGQMLAQLARGASQDLTATLFANPGDSDDLLYGLDMSRMISAQSYAVYTRATQDRNTAQSLSDTAAVAEAELKVLEEKSHVAYEAAQVASAAASEAYQAQQANLQTLQQQVLYLEGQVPLVEAQFRAGLIEKFKADVNLDVAYVSEQGWVKPAGGYITSGFGWRVDPVGFHKGTDLGAGCGANIYAATYGTVTMAIYGYNGGYGNMIEITHDDGTATRYGHIQDGGILVSYGERVGIGQNIAKVGNTGYSFGCHLHFETFDGNAFVNPVGFMADRGITLG
jgi:murein DD-endopeptidase MepM/ murein hydrolase activator NlpD